jgi:thiaminase/transcriptional activator TenA
VPISDTLWQLNADLAQICLDLPFVRGIGDGSLPRERFAWYIGQDAFYLQAFARAYTLAAAKAPDWNGFQELHELAGGVLQELELHKGIATAWGLNLAQITPGLATRRYTDFLLATAWGQRNWDHYCRHDSLYAALHLARRAVGGPAAHITRLQRLDRHLQ